MNDKETENVLLLSDSPMNHHTNFVLKNIKIIYIYLLRVIVLTGETASNKLLKMAGIFLFAKIIEK